MDIKYVGSKARVSKDISKIINNIIEKENIFTYIEPFVGGANIIEKIECDNKIGYDNNEYLISMWNAFKNGYEPPENITKEEYTYVKNHKDEFPKEYVAIVGFCSTYNAGWFRRYGAFAITKEGKIRNYYQEAIRNIKKQIPNILDVHFQVKDFFDLYCDNCLIYCDPPYKTSHYIMYEEKDFDYNKYWEKIRFLSKNNIVLCSEYEAPKDFECIWSKELTTTLDKASRSKAVEKLFKYKG